jgi:hypothetical protein
MSNRQGGSLHPPPNFSIVEHGIMRSAYPLDVRHVHYLRQHAGVRTVLQLSLEQLSGPVLQALAAQPTTRHVAHHDGTKDDQGPSASTSCTVICVHCVAPAEATGFGSVDAIVQTALDYIVDVSYHPLLLCCPQGDVETSAVVACLRRLQGWCTTSALSEAELHTSTGNTAVRREVCGCVEGYAFDPTYYAQDFMQQRKATRIQRFAQRTHSGEVQSIMRSVLRGEPRPLLVDKYRKGRGRRLSVTSDPDTVEAHAAHMEDMLSSSALGADGGGPSSMTRGESPETGNGAGAFGASPSTASSRLLHESMRSHAGLRRLTSEGNKDVVVASPLLRAAITKSLGQLVLAPQRDHGLVSSGPLPPHEKYWWCVNPPVLDARSTFTADSLVEEDDD